MISLKLIIPSKALHLRLADGSDKAMYYHLLEQERAKEERFLSEIGQDRLIKEARKTRARHINTLLARLYSFILGSKIVIRKPLRIALHYKDAKESK